MADLIFVGFRTREGPDKEPTFDEVTLVDVARKRKATYAFEGRDPDDPARAKGTIAKACRDFICYGREFPPFPHRPGGCPAHVVGFNTGDFVSCLAEECALPSRGSLPLPACVDDSESYTDLTGYVRGHPYSLEMAKVFHPREPVEGAPAESVETAHLKAWWKGLLQYTPADPDAAAWYKARVASWEGWGKNTELDVTLAFHLAACYGLVAAPAAAGEGT